jgi:hypothetical protein
LPASATKAFLDKFVATYPGIMFVTFTPYYDTYDLIESSIPIKACLDPA